MYRTFSRHRVLFGGCRGHGADRVEGRPPEPPRCTIDININRAYTKSEYEHGGDHANGMQSGRETVKTETGSKRGAVGGGGGWDIKELQKAESLSENTPYLDPDVS